MRISSVQAFRTGRPSFQKNGTVTPLKTEVPEIGSFFAKNKAVRGAGLGAIIGLGTMALISGLSGGFATPLAYGLYAAAFGTAGGLAGKAASEFDAEA